MQEPKPCGVLPYTLVKPTKHGNSWYARLPLEWVRANDLMGEQRMLRVYEEDTCLFITPSAVIDEKAA